MNAESNKVDIMTSPKARPKSSSSIDVPSNGDMINKNIGISHQNKSNSTKDINGKKLEYSSIDLKNFKTNKLPTVDELNGKLPEKMPSVFDFTVCTYEESRARLKMGSPAAIILIIKCCFNTGIFT